jgi:transposase
MLNMTAGQQVLRRLDGAFRAFFQGKRGFPRFKRASRFNSVNYKPGDGAAVRGRKLYVQNVGLIPVRWHRALPEGKLKNIILLRKPSGWYACLQVELPEPEPERSTGPAVGIDMGLIHALTLSDGTTFDSPKYLQESLARLRRLQRTVARRRKAAGAGARRLASWPGSRSTSPINGATGGTRSRAGSWTATAQSCSKSCLSHSCSRTATGLPGTPSPARPTTLV